MDELRIKRCIQSIERISHKHFVIHGSHCRRPVLIPQKPALTTNNKKLRKRAVYATSVVAVAVLYATYRGDPIWKYGRGKGMRLRITGEGFNVCDGFIQVCQRRSFEGGMFVSHSKKPVRVIRNIRVRHALLKYFLDKKSIRLVESFAE